MHLGIRLFLSALLIMVAAGAGVGTVESAEFDEAAGWVFMVLILCNWALCYRRPE